MIFANEEWLEYTTTTISFTHLLTVTLKRHRYHFIYRPHTVTTEIPNHTNKPTNELGKTVSLLLLLLLN